MATPAPVHAASQLHPRMKPIKPLSGVKSALVVAEHCRMRVISLAELHAIGADFDDGGTRPRTF